MSSNAPGRPPPGLGAPPGLAAPASPSRGQRNASASPSQSVSGASTGSGNSGKSPARWNAGTDKPNDAVSVRPDGSVVLEGVSPADEEAMNVGTSPSLGGRTGLTDLMDAIEDIDMGAGEADAGEGDAEEVPEEMQGNDEINDDFLNPTSELAG